MWQEVGYWLVLPGTGTGANADYVVHQILVQAESRIL